MTMTAAEKWLNEQRRMKENAARWPNTDEDVRRWPVLVTETHEHIVWVEAETAEDAVRAANYDTYELINNETRAEAWFDVAALDKWNHDKAYDGGSCGYQGLECNAHVETRRWWLAQMDRAHQEATAHNEDREQVPAEQRLTCALCRIWREDGHETSSWHLFEVRSTESRKQGAVA